MNNISVDPIELVFWFLFVFCFGAFCFGMWDEIARATSRVRQRLRAWCRHQQGHILPVLFLFATAGIGWLYVWAKWILTHEPE